MSSSIKDIVYASLISTIKQHVAPYAIGNLNKKGIQFTVDELMACFPEANTVVNTHTTSNFVPSTSSQPFGSNTAAANNSLYTPSATKGGTRNKEIKCEKAQYEEDRCWYHTRTNPPKRCESIRFDEYLCENCLTNKKTAKTVVRKMFQNAYPEGNGASASTASGSGGPQNSMGGAAPFASMTRGTASSSGNGSSRQVAPANFQGHRPIGVGQPFAGQQQQVPVNVPIKTVDCVQVGTKIYYDQKNNLVFYGDQTEGYNVVGRLEEDTNVVCVLEQDEIDMCIDMGLSPLTEHQLINTVISTQPVAVAVTQTQPRSTMSRSSTRTTAAANQPQSAAPQPSTSRVTGSRSGTGFASVGMSSPGSIGSPATSVATSSSSSTTFPTGKQHFNPSSSSSTGPTSTSRFSAQPQSQSQSQSQPQSQPRAGVQSRIPAPVTSQPAATQPVQQVQAPVTTTIRRRAAQAAVAAAPAVESTPASTPVSNDTTPTTPTVTSQRTNRFTQRGAQPQQTSQSTHVETQHENQPDHNQEQGEETHDTEQEQEQEQEQQDDFVTTDKDYSEGMGSDGEEDVKSEEEE